SSRVTAHLGSAVPSIPHYSGTGRPSAARYPDAARSVKQLVIDAGRDAAKGVQWREGSRSGSGRSGLSGR
ncbi:IS701 family transposase, partial [Streptomyces sp. NPDC000410]